MALDVTKLLEVTLAQAKQERAAWRYSEDEKMGNTCIAIGPEGQASAVPLRWRNNDEKHFKMKALAKAARACRTQAIVLVSDTRWLKADIFALHFGLPQPAECGLENFQQRYLAIMATMFDGQIKNLPHELWNEAVIAAIKGPAIKPQVRMASYCQGPNDEVVYTTGMDDKGDEAFLNIIPDWWIQ